MANNSQYNLTGQSNPGRSVFDLSYQKLFNCELGDLIPVVCDFFEPSSIVSLANEIVVRFNPMVAPVLHEINCEVHYFFAPARILDTGSFDWESFITGGEDGLDSQTIPRWDNLSSSDTAKYKLWDYLGFPTGVTVPSGDSKAPLLMPKTAYNLIYQEWYRDENLQSITSNNNIRKRNWEKDYFSSALPWQQRGTAPALPISGFGDVLGIGNSDQSYPAGGGTRYESDGGSTTYANESKIDTAATWYIKGTGLSSAYPDIQADLSSATTFDVADLRLAFQIQKWLERNARAGGRYVEFIQAHFPSVKASELDARLQRPEYIGGTRQSVVISEVLNTSATATEAQGNLAGHGLSVDGNGVGRYRVKEYGVIMGILSIMPRLQYSSQGINRQWAPVTKYDFYHPEFANLSEQPIWASELYYNNTVDDDSLFGYQGRYDEHRTKQDMVCADMRDTFDYWHLAEQFTSHPALNSSFITCDPRKDIFASTSEPNCIVHINNKITAVRPMPIIAEPGYIDH